MSAVPNAFNFSAAPFDCLSGDERRLVRDSVDIVLLHDGQQLLAPGEPVGHVFVLIQGHVQQWEGGELLATFGTDDCFDGRALAAGQASHRRGPGLPSAPGGGGGADRAQRRLRRAVVCPVVAAPGRAV
jgi:signal-transduction protein with cAMP-binding, CBS, and nucleotidyltransferase domain